MAQVNFDKNRADEAAKVRKEIEQRQADEDARRAAYEVVEDITLETLSTKGGGLFHVLWITNDRVKYELDRDGNHKRDENGNIKKVHVATVYDLDKRRVMDFLLHTVTKSKLDERFPNGYAGLCMRVEIPREKKEGRRYKEPDLKLLAVPEWLPAALAANKPPYTLDELQTIRHKAPTPSAAKHEPEPPTLEPAKA